MDEGEREREKEKEKRKESQVLQEQSLPLRLLVFVLVSLPSPEFRMTSNSALESMRGSRVSLSSSRHLTRSSESLIFLSSF